METVSQQYVGYAILIGSRQYITVVAFMQNATIEY